MIDERDFLFSPIVNLQRVQFSSRNEEREEGNRGREWNRDEKTKREMRKGKETEEKKRKRKGISTRVDSIAFEDEVSSTLCSFELHVRTFQGNTRLRFFVSFYHEITQFVPSHRFAPRLLLFKGYSLDIDRRY